MDKTGTSYILACGRVIRNTFSTNTGLMADHKVSVAVSLLVRFSLLCFQLVSCQQSGFRVFRTEAELREFQQLSARERLDVALLYPAAEILEITGANQAATMQEGVSLSIDCLPWLQQFPNGSIQWYSLQLDEFANVMDGTSLLANNRRIITRFLINCRSHRIYSMV